MATQQDYEKRIKLFYNGTFFVPGWNKITERLIKKFPQHAERLETELDQLGKMIAPEWAKDASERTVSNSDLMNYGNRLKKVSKASELFNLVDEIRQRVKERKA